MDLRRTARSHHQAKPGVPSCSWVKRDSAASPIKSSRGGSYYEKNGSIAGAVSELPFALRSATASELLRCWLLGYFSCGMPCLLLLGIRCPETAVFFKTLRQETQPSMRCALTRLRFFSRCNCKEADMAFRRILAEDSRDLAASGHRRIPRLSGVGHRTTDRSASCG